MSLLPPTLNLLLFLQQLVQTSNLLPKRPDGRFCPRRLLLSIIEPGKMAKVIHTSHLRHQSEQRPLVDLLVLGQEVNELTHDVTLVFSPVQMGQDTSIVQAVCEEAPEVRLVPIKMDKPLLQRLQRRWSNLLRSQSRCHGHHLG